MLFFSELLADVDFDKPACAVSVMVGVNDRAASVYGAPCQLFCAVGYFVPLVLL